MRFWMTLIRRAGPIPCRSESLETCGSAERRPSGDPSRLRRPGARIPDRDPSVYRSARSFGARRFRQNRWASPDLQAGQDWPRTAYSPLSRADPQPAGFRRQRFWKERSCSTALRLQQRREEWCRASQKPAQACRNDSPGWYRNPHPAISRSVHRFPRLRR